MRCESHYDQTIQYFLVRGSSWNDFQHQTNDPDGWNDSAKILNILRNEEEKEELKEEIEEEKVEEREKGEEEKGEVGGEGE